MDFVNHTGFPAQDFAGIDQYGQDFHVIALRQTLEWGDDVLLQYAEQQEPLCESDVYWGEPHASSVRQESDYCHFKPKCDVLVNATAYAPRGIPVPSFTVRLQVRMPDTEPPIPPRPQGLNQFMNPSPEALKKWQDSFSREPIRGNVLVDKMMRVYGPREFRRRGLWGRSATALARIATLGLAKFSPWILTRPTPVLSVPLRSEFAFGGECRITAESPVARRVPTKYRLTETQRSMHGALDERFSRKTVAYASFDANPLGRGFAVPWFLKVSEAWRLAAPQIELPNNPVTERDFQACINGSVSDDIVARACGGFGVRAKYHPQRMRLSGTIDDVFAASDKWLPEDFSFAVWNAAEPDQQTDYLRGGELIELTNMCPAGTPGAKQDAAGNTVLTLTLPTNECYVVIRLESGELFAHSMAIDTVIAEPDERRLSIVWRTVLAHDDELAVRAVEVMSRTHAERDSQRREIEWYKAAVGQTAVHSNGESDE